MEIEKFLEEALKERFKTISVVNALEEKIKNKVEVNVFNRYKDKIIYANDLEYKLYKVKASLNHWNNEILLKDVSITLAYFCVSKLPKRKRDRIEKCKQYFDKCGRTEWSNFKTPIWSSLYYELSIKKLLKGDFNLQLEI